MRGLPSRVGRAKRLSEANVARLMARLRRDWLGRRPVVTPLGKGAWLVRSRTADRKLELQALDDKTWVVRRRGADQRSVGPGTPRHELRLLRHIGEEHVARVLRRLDVNIVLDVGANRGQFAKRLRSHGYTGRIVSFEPVPHIAEELEKSAASDDDWQVLRHALGERDEMTEMNVGVGQGRLSSLLHPSDFGRSWSSRIDSGDSVPVSVRRLDGMYEEIVAGASDPRVYLKLDTQGYDLKAFAGAGQRINDFVGMQSEVSAVPIYAGMPHFTEQLATYEAAGFELTGMFPVVLDAATMRVIEFDAVMIRTSALVG